MNSYRVYMIWRENPLDLSQSGLQESKVYIDRLTAKKRIKELERTQMSMVPEGDPLFNYIAIPAEAVGDLRDMELL